MGILCCIMGQNDFLLVKSAHDGNIDELTKILDENPNIAIISYITAMQYAIIANNLECLVILLERIILSYYNIKEKYENFDETQLAKDFSKRTGMKEEYFYKIYSETKIKLEKKYLELSSVMDMLREGFEFLKDCKEDNFSRRIRPILEKI